MRESRSHLYVNIYLQYLSSEEYNPEKPTCEPSRIILDNEATIAMSKWDKDTAGNRHLAKRYHYVHQETMLKEHIF